jgi:Tfp pilus assembly protein PilN
MYYLHMHSVRKKLQNFNPQQLQVPLSILIALVVCCVGVSAFALGWVARGQSQTTTVQTRNIDLSALSGQQAGGSALYVGSRNSDHYHYRWCAGADRISADNKIYFNSPEQAQKEGYEPAGNCPGLE